MATLGKALADIVSEINRSELSLLNQIRELTNESDVQINGIPVPPIAFVPDTYIGFDEFRIAFDFEIHSYLSESSAKHGSGEGSLKARLLNFGGELEGEIRRTRKKRRTTDRSAHISIEAVLRRQEAPPIVKYLRDELTRKAIQNSEHKK